MKFPKELLIGDSVWTIRNVRRIGYDNKTDKETIGLCDPGTNEILIKCGLTKKERLEVFVHECFHAIEFEYDLKIEHRLIYALEGKIARLLTDNFLGEL